MVELQQPHGFKENIDAFEPAELPEERKAVPMRPPLVFDNSDGSSSVVLKPNPLFGDPPLHVSLHQESTGGQKEINECKLRLDESLSKKERLWGDMRETTVATLWAFFVTQLIVWVPNHLTVTCAYRQIFVKGVKNRGIRERVSDFANQVVAEKQGVLEMNDIRPDCQKKRPKVL